MDNIILIDSDKIDNTLFTRFLINHTNSVNSGEYVTIGAGCVFATSKAVVYMYNQDVVITYPGLEILHLDYPEDLGYSIVYLDKFIVPQSKAN
jgi:hypothetical protein